MKKRTLAIISLVSLAALVFLGFISASLLNSSATPTSVNASQPYLYNFTINNTNSPPGINFTQVSITFPSGFSFSASTNGTSTSGDLSISGQTLSWTNTTSIGIISNGTVGYFWINATSSQAGTKNISISSTDTSGNTNTTTISVSVSDVTAPQISFASPTPSNDTTLDQNYIPVNLTASDNVVVSNVTIYLSGTSSSSKTLTSSSYFYNFTSLSNGNYTINATVYDTSGNKNSTDIRYVTLNFTNSSTASCTENWTCGNWSACSNDTQTRTCTDQNSCGTYVNEPNTTQSCTPACQTNWEKGNWTPSPCGEGENQTQLWTDLNNCSQPLNKTRPCPSTSSSSSSASSASGKTSNSSVSGLFLGIVGFIILSIVIIVVVLMRMKNKHSKKDSVYNIQPNGGGYGPPGSPPGSPPGYGPPRY